MLIPASRIFYGFPFPESNQPSAMPATSRPRIAADICASGQMTDWIEAEFGPGRCLQENIDSRTWTATLGG
jgi:hypothetical protein